MNDNIFDYVMSHVNIVDVISHYTKVERKGRSIKALCPFHGEKTPSLSIDEDRGLYHCFGCGASGNTITFVAEKENLDRLDAAKLIAERFGIDVTSFERRNFQKNSRTLEIMRDVANYYYKKLKQSPDALAYIRHRGISDRVITKYGIGYAPKQRPSVTQLFSKKYSLNELVDAGISTIREGRQYDKFFGRIIFPIVDQRGRVLGFGGRVLDNAKPKYLNSSDAPFFKKGEILFALNHARKSNMVKNEKTLLLAEGYMDVISLEEHGIDYAVASLGTALTQEHAELLKRYAEKVIICYDGDTAGKSAALKAVKLLQQHVSHVFVLTLEQGMDPDEYLRKYGVETFKKQLQCAMSDYEYLIHQLSLNYDVTDGLQKTEFLTEACALISEIKNGLRQSYYVDFLHRTYDVPKPLLEKQIAWDKGTQKKLAPLAQKEFKSIDKMLAIYVLHHTMSMAQDQFLTVIETTKGSEAGEFYQQLYKYRSEHPAEQIDFAVLSEYIGMEKAQKAQDLYINHEPEHNLSYLLINYELVRVQKQMNEVHNTDELQALFQKKANLTAKLRES